jgi:nucleoside-diphosphate-sugar epimerase
MIAAISGANGFIGQHLVREFSDAGWLVRPIVRRDYELGTMASAVAGADVVVHAAGATRAATIAELDRSNVDLTARTLEAAERGGASRFIYISSQAAAGPAASLSAPTTEDAAPAPIEAYGRAKLRAEELVRRGNLEHVIVRPVSTYGPGDRDFLAVFRLAKRGLAIHPANREHWISIVHVADLARAILASATARDAAGQTFFLGAPEPVQWRDLFARAARAMGTRIAIDAELPAVVVRIAGALGDVAARTSGRAGLMTSEKIALSRPRYWVCSSAHARRVLGFEPTIDLQAGLRESYHWYRAAGWL